MGRFRNKVILTILFQISLLCVNLGVWADDYKLFWLEKTMPTEEIFEFAKLSEDDMIDALREKYGVHVVIVPDPEEVKNPKLTKGTLKEDEELLTYFLALKAAYKRYDEAFNENAIEREYSASYLDRYYISSNPLFNVDLNNDRPVIYIKESAGASTLVHEFMHFYIDQILLSSAPVEMDGKRCHPRDVKRIEKIKAVGQFLDAQRAFEKDPKHLKEAVALAEKVIGLYLESDRDIEREEIDVYRFMHENRNQFGLDEEKTELSLRVMGSYVAGLAKSLKLIIGLGKDEGIAAIPWLFERRLEEIMWIEPEDQDPYIRDVSIRVGKAVTRVEGKIRDSAHYVNRELKAMGKPPYFLSLKEAEPQSQEK